MSTIPARGAKAGAYVSDDGEGCLWLRCGRCHRHLVTVDAGDTLTALSAVACTCTCTAQDREGEGR